MVTKGGFTLSLDCEGLWGMADQLNTVSAGIINQSSLTSAYDFVAQTLHEQEVRSTAAFVTAFAAGRDMLPQKLPILRELARLVPFWYDNILLAIEKRNLDGWDGNAFFARFTSDGHEMAWHGTTHLSLENDTPDEAVELELDLTASFLSALNFHPTSIVFPRNRVGHLRQLKRAGFQTYRTQRGHGRVNKLLGLIREWNIIDKNVDEKPYYDNEWFISPPGYFLNWPARVRALVPTSITIMRWQSLLRATAENGGYVHMWFHPHNLITAPAMREAFTAVMQEVGQLSRSGDLAILTMHEANGYFAEHSKGEGA